MGSGVFSPAAATDTGHCDFSYAFYPTGYNNTSNTVCKWQNHPNGAFCRFAGLTIPAGATIVSAFIRLTAYDSRSVAGAASLLSFQTAVTPAVPTSCSAMTSAAKTAATAWSMPAFVAGQTYDTPDLSAALQAVVDLAGWASGSAVLAFLMDNASADDSYRAWYAYAYNGGAAAPQLHVTWTTPAAVFGADEITVSDPGLSPLPALIPAGEVAVTDPGITVGGFGRVLTAVRRIPLGLDLTAVRRLPIGRILTAVRRIPAPLGVTLTAVRRIPVEVGRELTAVRRILDHNPLGVTLAARRRIPSSGSALMRSVPWSAVWDDDGTPLELLGATLSGDRDSLAWSCDLSLADAEAYAACTPGRRLTLTLAGRAWALLIEGRTREAACGTRDYAATARTVSCLLDAPYAALLTQSWPAVTAKAAAVALAALAGLSLDWQVVDWTLPAGRLTAEAETPAALIARLAASCGAVAMPDPAGGVLVRYAYPVGVPEMAAAAPVATLSDDEDVETLGETFVAGTGYNAVTVVDNRQTTEAYLAWELDSDRNAGRSTFPPGEPCYLRVYHEEDYTLKTSLGLLELVTADIEETVDKVVGFADADSADLGGLVTAVTSCVWYGPDLGTLVPSGGGMVVASAGAGFSVAAVSYRTRYDLWRLTAPAVADAYTIQLGLEEVEP